MADATFRIERLTRDSDYPPIIDLFEAYAKSLKLDLAFQDFEAELTNFPGKYAPPSGVILVAWDVRSKALGCVALRPLLPTGSCEMKRLYVTPEGRGLGLGKALVNAIMKEAECIGYKLMKLDTLPTMTSAIRLYQQLGFVHAKAYYDTPVAGTVFLQRSLATE